MTLRSAASFAFVALWQLAGCSRAPCAPETPSVGGAPGPAAPAPAPIAPLGAQPFLQRTHDLGRVRGVLFSPSGDRLAIAGDHVYGASCFGSRVTTLWLYDVATSQPLLVIQPAGELAAWAFDDDGETLVVAMADTGRGANPRSVRGFDLESGLEVAAPPAPLAEPRASLKSQSGDLLVKSDGQRVELWRRGERRPWLSFGGQGSVLAAGLQFTTGELVFAARWPTGAFAAWDVVTNARLSLSPPAPARVTGVAAAEDDLVIAGADGSFWIYRPGSRGALDGTKVSRSNALVKEVLDVTSFSGREPAKDIGLIGGDPNAPLLIDGVVRLSVSCDGASCGYQVGEGVLVSASNQPGQLNVSDGLRSEPLETAADFFVCRLENRVVPMAACNEWTRESQLFARALATPP